LLSKSNPRVKLIRRLNRRRTREQEGKFLVEGIRLLEEALRENWPLRQVIYTAELTANPRGAGLLEALAQQGVPAEPVDEELFAELAETETPQGIIAVAAMAGRPISDLQLILNGEPDLLVLVDGVRDPGNLGTIIRCADAYGAGGVLLLKGTVDPYNPKTIRATMGAIFRVPLLSVENSEHLAEAWKAGGWKLVAGDPAADKLIHHCDLTGRVILAVGGEADGFSGNLGSFLDETVRIPMPGRAESLNAGVAAGIMLYEAVRQRMSR